MVAVTKSFIMALGWLWVLLISVNVHANIAERRANPARKTLDFIVDLQERPLQAIWGRIPGQNRRGGSIEKRIDIQKVSRPINFIICMH